MESFGPSIPSRLPSQPSQDCSAQGVTRVAVGHRSQAASKAANRKLAGPVAPANNRVIKANKVTARVKARGVAIAAATALARVGAAVAALARAADPVRAVGAIRSNRVRRTEGPLSYRARDNECSPCTQIILSTQGESIEGIDA